MNYLLKSMLSDGNLLRPIYRKEANRFLDRLDFHPHYELYFCRAPLPQRLKIGGEERALCEPCALILPPFTVHHISLSEPRESFERYVIYFGEELLSRFHEQVLSRALLKPQTGVLLTLSEEEAKDLSSLLPLLYEETERGSSEASSACALALLLNRLSLFSRSRPPYFFEETVQRIPEVLAYIWHHVDEDLSADRLAERFMVSRPTLDRDFRRYVGQSVHQTVMDCRIWHALTLLRTTDRSVAQIAVCCGFESEYYFYSFFKRLTGKTPSEWRNENDPSTASL